VCWSGCVLDWRGCANHWNLLHRLDRWHGGYVMDFSAALHAQFHVTTLQLKFRDVLFNQEVD